MTVALRSPKSIGALVSVDNSPVNATLKSNFYKYTRGMRDIEAAKVTRQAQADDILKAYEEVSRSQKQHLVELGVGYVTESRFRPYQYGNSFSPT